MSRTPESLPKWDLKNIYRGFTTEDHQADVAEVQQLLKTMQERLEGSESSKIAADPGAWIAEQLRAVNSILELYGQLEAYAYMRYSSDTQDEEAIAGISEAESLGTELKAVFVALKNRLAEIPENQIESLSSAANSAHSYSAESSHDLSGYGYILKEMIHEQQHQMTPELESLTADLQRSGGDAWGRLQEAVSSTASIVWDEKTGERKTAVQLRAMAFSKDREVRRKAYQKELELWKTFEVPLAFSLNGVKGWSNSLDSRRRYQDSLDRAVQQTRITRKALDAIISALEDYLPSYRAYFRKKASLLGLEKLAFYDLFAPVGADTKQWTFDEAQSFIVDQFSKFHPPMGSFAADAFASGWIDAEMRDGKVGGAYCISLPKSGESRVLCNFDGSFSSVSTVAHELGHAYHGHILRRQPALLREYPMTLAETASIFSEAVIFHGALKSSEGEEHRAILEMFLQEAAQLNVDILSRFYFERDLIQQRRSGDLTPAALCDAMLSAQKRTYGDALDRDSLHPYMWAVKGHYYSPDMAFYNFPYAFGHLFGLGLYAEYEKQGSSFGDVYNELLLSTGSTSAVDVTAKAGFSIETPEFWKSGLEMVKKLSDKLC